MSYESIWLCDECHKKQCAKYGELWVATIGNTFEIYKCVHCNETADHLTEIPLDDEWNDECEWADAGGGEHATNS